MTSKRKVAAVGVLAAGLTALAAPVAGAQIEDVLNELGGRVVSTTDTVIEEIGGGSPNAVVEEIIIEDYVYVTAPVEDYLPPIDQQASAPAPAPVAYGPSDSQAGYVGQAAAATASTGAESTAYIWSAAPALANTGASVIALFAVAFLALIGSAVFFYTSNRKKAAAEAEGADSPEKDA